MEAFGLCLILGSNVCLILRSGTEEEYSELSQLLDDILSYQKDFEALREEEKKREKSKKENERKQGEMMRQTAMEGRTSMYVIYAIKCFMFHASSYYIYREEVVYRFG